MKQPFEDFDFFDFWDDDEYALREYVSESPSDILITDIEQRLGYKLPLSYISLMKSHNGGVPINLCYPMDEATSWSENHVQISGIFGIGDKLSYSICGALGSQFMIDEWGYPATGVYICSTPSAGHEMILLDYSKCGANGEPEVVHVDQEFGYKKTFVAKDFETFIRGLVNESEFDTSEEDLKNDIVKIETGELSTKLKQLISNFRDNDLESALRATCKELTTQKEYFGLHGDELSHLVYDLQFLLLSKSEKVKSKDDFLEKYPEIIALGDGEFSTGGYAADFVSEWFDLRVKENKISKKLFRGLQMSSSFSNEIIRRAKSFI